MAFDWRHKEVLVTGGASFIGSHVVDALVARGAHVRIVDDLSSGEESNIATHLARGAVHFMRADLRNPGVARKAMAGMEVVFHLAADHGGRGYVDLRQAGPASNLLLDGMVFWEAHRAGVERVVFASSGCVYPNFLQGDAAQAMYLSEDLVKPPYDADNVYGYAKLMGELTLKSYAVEYGMKTASCRYFTVYGPRAKENHAVMAMIARAMVKQDPFEVWGTGEQIRNWTYVDDIVTGTILAAEKIEDGTAVNLGTTERIRVFDAARLILNLLGHKAAIATRPDMPTGPLNRVADNRLAEQLLGWRPSYTFEQGVRQTIEWYGAAKTPAQVRQILDLGGLIERKVVLPA